jgi:hypothetical protein
MKKTNIKAPSVIVTALIASIAELAKLDLKAACAAFAAKATVQRSAFAEMGKLHRIIAPQLKLPQTIYGELRKLGVKDTTIANASYAAKTIETLVEPGHLTEQDYNGMTFDDHFAIARSMGNKSFRKLTAEDVAAIVKAKPDTFDADLKSIFDSGMDVDEAAAQAAAQKRLEKEAKKKEEDERVATAAQKLHDESELARIASEAAKSAGAPSVPTAGETPVPVVPVTGETAAAAPASPVAGTPAAQVPGKPADGKIVQIPASPDAAVPETLHTLDVVARTAHGFTAAGKKTILDKLREVMDGLLAALPAKEQAAWKRAA